MSYKELAGLLKDAVEKMDGGEEASGWTKPAEKPTNAPFLGVSIPIKVETPVGIARCYLSLPAEVAANPETLLRAIKELLDMGIPVDLYQPRDNNGGGGGGGSWRDNGGYGGGGGGYNRGGYNGGGGYNRGGGGYNRGGRW